MTREQAMDLAAEHLAAGYVLRDALPPREAAVAAGARTEEEVAHLAAGIAADRQRRAYSA
ncbi:MAG: hypothetical protein ACYDAQ_06905 [Mycobacteriales bacterium]